MRMFFCAEKKFDIEGKIFIYFQPVLKFIKPLLGERGRFSSAGLFWRVPLNCTGDSCKVTLDIAPFFEDIVPFGNLEIYSKRIIFSRRKNIWITCHFPVYADKTPHNIQGRFYKVILTLLIPFWAWSIDLEMNKEK